MFKKHFMNLIVVSNRLPISVKRNGKKLDGNTFTYTRNSGGLVTGLLCVNKTVAFLWMGNIPGSFTADEKDELKSYIRENYDSVPIFVPRKYNHLAYDGYCNQILWPLFHFFRDNLNISTEFYEAYKKYNQMFADAIFKQIKDMFSNEKDPLDDIAKSSTSLIEEHSDHNNNPNDKKSFSIDREDDSLVLWIHDYHLLLLPKIIRDGLGKIISDPNAINDVKSSGVDSEVEYNDSFSSNLLSTTSTVQLSSSIQSNNPVHGSEKVSMFLRSVKIAFFLHIPWPTPEVFYVLPEAHEIIDSVQAADLVAFHTEEYCINFKACLDEITKKHVCVICRDEIDLNTIEFEECVCSENQNENYEPKHERKSITGQRETEEKHDSTEITENSTSPREKSSISNHMKDKETRNGYVNDIHHSLDNKIVNKTESEVSLSDLTYNNLKSKVSRLKYSNKYNTYLNNHKNIKEEMSVASDKTSASLEKRASLERNMQKDSHAKDGNITTKIHSIGNFIHQKNVNDIYNQVFEENLKRTLLICNPPLTECVVNKREKYKPKLKCNICKVQEGICQISSSDENDNSKNTQFSDRIGKMSKNDSFSTVIEGGASTFEDGDISSGQKSHFSRSQCTQMRSSAQITDTLGKGKDLDDFQEEKKIKPKLKPVDILQQIKAIPIGINPSYFSDQIHDDCTQKFINFYRKKFDGCFIIVGVDRVDYIKGIPERIKAYNKFKKIKKDIQEGKESSFRELVQTTCLNDFSSLDTLKNKSKCERILCEDSATNNPCFSDSEIETLKNTKTAFIQIGVPSRNNLKSYRFLNSKIIEECNDVNDSKNTNDLFDNHDKIYYLYNPITIPELIALYYISDMLIISSVRDGMNLVAMEYIACSLGKDLTEDNHLYETKESKNNISDKLGQWISSSMESLTLNKSHTETIIKNNIKRDTDESAECKFSQQNDFTKGIQPNNFITQDLLDDIKNANIESFEAKFQLESKVQQFEKRKNRKEKLPGILVLSSFAGTANYLSGSVFVNPWDEDSITKAIFRGILMKDNERTRRFFVNHRIIHRISADEWANQNICSLNFSKTEEDSLK